MTCEGDACAVLQADWDRDRRAYSFRNLGERVIRLSITGETGAIALSLQPDEVLYVDIRSIECPVLASFVVTKHPGQAY